ncbi:MAG TPA: response regulator [Candidatus Acidoferrales bacterium]|nr:response regulator [Candidatus Acidoferrales bacterium]
MSTLTSKPGSSNAAEAAARKMPKVLVVDDDETIRRMFRMRLADTYEIVDTGDPEQAVALTLEQKPDAILMDLMMPGFSGFELCQTLHTLSYTSRIPIFVVTGESGTKYKEHCASLGAKGFFQKPIDFAALKATLAAEMQTKLPERRKHKRVQMRVLLRLRGVGGDGKSFEQLTTTENLSAGGFLANCAATLSKGTAVEVFLTAGGHERFAGRAQAVRKESPGSPWQRYGFQFIETTSDWVLQDK